jgi:hypothetical protein
MGAVIVLQRILAEQGGLPNCGSWGLVIEVNRCDLAAFHLTFSS